MIPSKVSNSKEIDSTCHRWELKNEDNLRNEVNLENEDNCENEENTKKEDDQKHSLKK